jgi:hypothetical protein
MDPLTIITLLNAVAELTPKVFAMAAAAKATMSATDAASVQAALEAAQAAANVDLDKALTDLDAAAKT